MSKKKYTIVIIGNGKLALAWFDYLKQNSNVAELHFLIRSNSKNKIPQTTNLHKKISTIQHPVDLFILAVSDRAILENARKVYNYFPKSMVWHCSGTHALVSLPQKQSLKMVVYPMYSFNGLHQTNWTQIPLFTEGLNTAFKKQLFYSLFNKKQTHYPTSFKDRQRVHLAAVIAQNFSNMLLIWAESQLPKSFKNKKIWHPLLQYWIVNLKKYNPIELQTGPAVRNDSWIISQHLKLIPQSQLNKLYKLLSNLIKKRHEL